VSEDAFEEEYSSLLDQYRSYGVGEETYREAIRAQLYREKLGDALAVEAELAEEAEHASVYVLTFTDESVANEALDQIQEEDFLTVWNTIRSLPADERLDGTAREVLWQTEERLAEQLGPDAAEAAFELPLDSPSEILLEVTEPAATAEDTGELEQVTRYHIIQVSGREVRDLSETTIENTKQELVAELIQQLRDEVNVEIFPIWRSRVPTQPILDPTFLVPPTQAAPQPTLPAVEPEPTEAETE
jgi:hypothetical protein